MKKRDTQVTVISRGDVGGNMAHGLLHATHHSYIVLVLLLLCPGKTWSWAITGRAYRWTDMCVSTVLVYRDGDEKMLTRTCPSQDTTAECWHASHMGRPVHTEHTQSASHTSRPHTHTVVVHTRILVSVAVRPRGKLESIVVTVLLPFTAVEQNS